jgi:hypothetical protein
MLAVTESHQSYKYGTVSHQLTGVGGVRDVRWGRSEVMSKKQKNSP